MQIIEETGRYSEIEQLEGARYVSVSEAAERILAYDIVDNNLQVYHLEVRREGYHNVHLQELPAP